MSGRSWEQSASHPAIFVPADWCSSLMAAMPAALRSCLRLVSYPPAPKSSSRKPAATESSCELCEDLSPRRHGGAIDFERLSVGDMKILKRFWDASRMHSHSSY